MKNITKWTGLFAMLLLALSACKKDENKIYFEGGTAPVLSASSSTITLSDATANETAVTFNWTNPEYNFTTGTSSQDVSYTLEMDIAGTNFSSSVKKTYTIAKDLSKSFTVSELNTVLATTMELPAGKASDIEVRILSAIGKAATTQLSSNSITFTVTPYEPPVLVTYIYVPGNYQGWSPGTAPMLASLDTKAYEGYVSFATDANEFKITTNPDWDHTNYGDGGVGKLSTAGDNIKVVTDAGFYRFNVQLDKLTYTYTLTDWGIVGAATPGGWDNSTPLTYNATTKMLEATVALTADEYKFRANNAWDINLGSNGTTNGLAYGGGNFKLTEGGNYLVQLNLSNPPTYSFKLTKL